MMTLSENDAKFRPTAGLTNPADVVLRGSRTKTAQASIEMLAVFAVALIILLVLVDFTTQQFVSVQKQRAVTTAESALKTIVAAVNEVYGQGPGASKQLVVLWPEGLDANQSVISNRTIKIRVFDTDVSASAVPLITGSLPTSAGNQFLRIKAFDGFVGIGDVSLGASPSSLFVNMSRDSNQTQRIVFSNASSSAATLSFTLDWNHSLVDVNLSSTNANVASGAIYNLDFNLHADPTAVGTYAGKLNVLGVYSGKVESLFIPILVDVSVSSATLLASSPATIMIAAFPGDTNSVQVQVCNLGNAQMKTISFTPSVGNPGDWVQGINDINTLDAQTCSTVTVGVTVPSSVGVGTYNGALTLRDFSGAFVNTVPLSVQSKGMNYAFSWDWSTASKSTNAISGFGLSNTGTKPLAITSVTIRKWWACDNAHGSLTEIKVNGLVQFMGSVNDGAAADVVDFNIPVLTSYTNNRLLFSSTINDNNEAFSADVMFSDATTYYSSTFSGTCGPDLTAPDAVTNLAAFGSGSPGTVLLTFTFPGDDKLMGTATGAIFKYSSSRIDTDALFSAAANTPNSFTGPFLTGGTDGNFTVTGLASGNPYYFAVKFYDENNNVASLSNSPLVTVP